MKINEKINETKLILHWSKLEFSNLLPVRYTQRLQIKLPIWNILGLSKKIYSCYFCAISLRLSVQYFWNVRSWLFVPYYRVIDCAIFYWFLEVLVSTRIFHNKYCAKCNIVPFSPVFKQHKPHGRNDSQGIWSCFINPYTLNLLFRYYIINNDVVNSAHVICLLDHSILTYFQFRYHYNPLC